jgi:hypothetical protein
MWAVPNPENKYGGAFIGTGQQQTTQATALKDVAAPAAKHGPGGLFSPREPLFWFAVIAATSFGLAAYSTTIRVGGSQVSLDVGKG